MNHLEFHNTGPDQVPGLAVTFGRDPERARFRIGQLNKLAIEFSILDKNRAVLIEIDGILDADQTEAMRQRCVALVAETGIADFIVDMRRLEALERGDPAAIVDLANKFKDHDFTVWSNTAVLMPTSERAYEQIELLHSIEVNRGRGVMNYVETIDEAFSWFEEMARRVSAPIALRKTFSPA